MYTAELTADFHASILNTKQSRRRRNVYFMLVYPTTVPRRHSDAVSTSIENKHGICSNVVNYLVHRKLYIHLHNIKYHIL